MQVKKCKEDNAIALAEAVRTGTIDKFVHRHPAQRMKKEKKVEVDRNLLYTYFSTIGPITWQTIKLSSGGVTA